MNKYFMLGLAGLAFAACSNEEDAIVGGDADNKTMIVSIAGIGADTKAAQDPEDKWTPDTDETAYNNIETLNLLFTDDAGDILYKYTATKPAEGTEATDDAAKKWNALFTGNGIKFIGLQKVTQVHAIANQALSNETNVKDFKTDFINQGKGLTKNQVVYAGSDIDIDPMYQEPSDAQEEVKLPGAVDEESFYYDATIKLTPIVSRIQINSIKIATSGSTESFGPKGEETKYQVNWQNFKPILHGIYLNNFADYYYEFQSTYDLLTNQSYMSTDMEGASDNIAGGKWTVESQDRTDDAAYISYAANAYGQLLEYATEPTTGLVPLTIGEGKCIAFNIIVPFDPTTGNAETIDNPTIHFQFKGSVDGYKADPVRTDGTPLEETDWNYLRKAEVVIHNQLPTLEEGAFLFANVNTLYSEGKDSEGQGTGESSGSELVLTPGKIYNMDIDIYPINMTVDLDNPEAWNVVVKITVVPFTEENIYPGLGE